MGAYALLMMPRGRRILPKLAMGLGGGVVGGVMGGLLWHVIDPPRIAILGVEALIAVAVLLLATPHSPKPLILT